MRNGPISRIRQFLTSGRLDYIRKPGRLHRRGELHAWTLRMNRSLLGRAARQGIFGGGNSMSKGTEMGRSTTEKRAKGMLSQRPPESDLVAS